MSAHRPDRNEIREAETEYRRLKQVHEALSDMREAAYAVEQVKGFAAARFEGERWDSATEVLEQVRAEQSAAYDRVLAAKYGEAEGARMRAEAKAWLEGHQRRLREQRGRDTRQSR